MERPSPIDTPLHITAALALGTIALLVIGVQPILLGELVNASKVSLEGVGLVATAEIIALGLGVVASDLWQPIARLRGTGIAAALLVAAFDMVSTQLSGDAAMILVRAGAGVAEGVLLWTCTSIIVRTPSPERVAGIFFVVQTLAQAAGSMFLAQVVVPGSGWRGAFEAIAASAALAIVPALLLPRRIAPLAPAAVTGFRWSLPTSLPLMVSFMLFAAIGALWAYIEPLGKGAGLDARATQTLVGVVLLAQLVGGCAAAAAVRRLPVTAVLALGTVLLAGAAIVLGGAHAQPSRFGAACMVFGFAWLFLMPFQVRLALRADPGGRVAMLIPAAQLFGTAFGPLIASFFVHGEQAGTVPLVSAGFAAGAAMVLSLGSLWPSAAAQRTTGAA